MSKDKQRSKPLSLKTMNKANPVLLTRTLEALTDELHFTSKELSSKCYLALLDICSHRWNLKKVISLRPFKRPSNY